MARDPLAPKRVAAAIALCGLSYMMAASAPHWGSVGVGLGSIAAFVILWFWPAMRMRASASARRLIYPANAVRPERRTERLLPLNETPYLLLRSRPLVSQSLRERRRRRG